LSKLDARLLERVGGLDALHRNSKVAQILREVSASAPGGSVVHSAELDRVLALPRRNNPAEGERGEHLARLLTSYLKLPHGTESLRPVQAAMLHEAAEYRGGFFPVGVGYGKSYASFLFPTVMEAKRPVLVVPPSLREQTKRTGAHMRKHWQVDLSALTVLAYTEIQVESGLHKLDDLRPDLFIFDEVHALKNFSSTRTKRFREFFKTHPGVPAVVMSGSMTTRSLRDFWHILQWALPSLCFLPYRWRELDDWRRALDAKVRPEERMAPGALIQLCTDEQIVDAGRGAIDPLTAARIGFSRRMMETPGVIVTTEAAIPTSLLIRRRDVAVPRAVQVALDNMEKTWVTPGGEEIVEAIDYWRHARELSCGFYYRWVWPAHLTQAQRQEWIDARREWYAFVRGVLKQGRPGLDSMLMVTRAVERGQWTDGRGETELARWRRVQPTFDPIVTEPVWIDDFICRDAVEWAKQKTPEGGRGGGIIWYEHDAVGERIAELGGWPCLGGGDEAARTLALLAESNLRGDNRIAVCSIIAHREGKNLQAFDNNLIVPLPPNGSWCEQLLGRTHRPLQESDTVRVEIYQHTEGARESWTRALWDARYIEQTTRQKQKLLYADLEGLER
jgi:hypothetical protein